MRIREPEARAAYLAMGPDRNLRQLSADLIRDYGKEAPSQASVMLWSRKRAWQRAAADFDARVQDRVVSKAVAAQANETWDVAGALLGAAKILLKAETLLLAAQQAAEKGDARGMTSAAVEALKLREVLNGGVSDRTGTVSEREREAVDTLAALESSIRSKHSKAPNVAETGTA